MFEDIHGFFMEPVTYNGHIIWMLFLILKKNDVIGLEVPSNLSKQMLIETLSSLGVEFFNDKGKALLEFGGFENFVNKLPVIDS